MKARRPVTIIPDLLLAMVAAAWTMAAIFLAASFLATDLVDGDISKVFARVFAALLGIAGLLFAGIALLLLRDERRKADHYVVPMGVGVAVGIAQSLVFLNRVESWIFVPSLFLLLALRPFRRFAASLLPAKGNGS